MFGQKLCLGLSEQFDLPLERQMEIIKAAGFEAFFANRTLCEDMTPLAEKAEELGLIFQSIHAPFGRCRDMWLDDEDAAQRGVDELTECARVCQRLNVPIMVSHVYIGFEPGPVPTEKGLDRFARAVDACIKAGVKIAFENTEGEEFLAAVMKRFEGCENVGFCLDTGHEMCYNRSKDMLALYGDRLICTHLNDNLGISDYYGKIYWTDDLHLLPFDGIGDWQDIANRLDRHNYDGIMTFELCKKSKPGRHENDKYEQMATEQYISEAYSRACRVAALRKRIPERSV